METIIDKLIESLKDKNIIAFATVIVVAILFKLKNIIGFSAKRKNARKTTLKNALKCKHLQGESKSHLEEELATEHFKEATGVRAHKEFREAMIKLHQKAQGKLPFSHFGFATPHLSFENSELEVTISKSASRLYVLYYGAGIFSLLIGACLTSIGLLLKPSEIMQFLALWLLGIIFTIIGFFLMSQSFPVSSARLIKRFLDEKKKKKKK